MMFVEDLGELAYGIGEAVVLSKEVVLVAPEGDAADLPKSCDAEEVCNKEFWAGMVFDESCGCAVGSLTMTGSASAKCNGGCAGVMCLWSPGIRNPSPALTAERSRFSCS